MAAGGVLTGLVIVGIEAVRQSEASLYASLAGSEVIGALEPRSIAMAVGSLLISATGLFVAVDGAGRLDSLNHPEATQSV